MKLIIPLFKLYLLLFFCNFSYSQSSDSTVKTSLLWEVSSENNPGVSYIFGTHHLISGNFIDTIEQIREKIVNAKEVFIEADVINIDTNEMMSKTVLKEGECYIYPNSDDSVLIYNYIYERLYAATHEFMKYKPFFAALVLEYIDNMKGSVKSGKNVVNIDLYIQKLAIMNSQKLSFFETVTEQMSFITDSIPLNTQTKYLIQSIKERTDKKTNKGKEIDSCYRSLNLECIAQKSYIWFNADPVSRLLLSNRNLRWMDKIISGIEKNSAFIAVGALHLVGEEGLIELLRSRGYTLKPVKIN